LIVHEPKRESLHLVPANPTLELLPSLRMRDDAADRYRYLREKFEPKSCKLRRIVLDRLVQLAVGTMDETDDNYFLYFLRISSKVVACISPRK